MATMPSNGPLTFAELQSVFGGPSPIVLSNYYRGGAYVPSSPPQNASIPTSGPISLDQFYSSTSDVPATIFTFSPTISGNTQNYDLGAAARAAGWNGTDGLHATVTNNAIVGSNSTATPAFNVPSLPAGSSVVIANNNMILGCGGNGGNGGSNGSSSGVTAGSNGGPALHLAYPTTIYNYGTIAGGGGGGAGGAGYTSTSNPVAYFAGGGGGGGAGYGTGAGGNGGTAANGNGGNGGPGSTTGGGAGGGGPQGGGSGGGAGGVLGARGGDSSASGGAPGNYIDGISFSNFAVVGTLAGGSS